MGVKMFEARYGAGIINLKKYKDEMNGKISCRYYVCKGAHKRSWRM